jgi:hypothetical protein
MPGFDVDTASRAYLIGEDAGPDGLDRTSRPVAVRAGTHPDVIPGWRGDPGHPRGRRRTDDALPRGDGVEGRPP